MTSDPVGTGLEFLVDACECDPEALLARERLELVVRWILDDLDLPVVSDPVWHELDESGRLACVAALADAHLTVHIYPATGLVAFNLFATGNRLTWSWNELLRDLLGARRIEVRVVVRGTDGSLRRRERRPREYRGRRSRLRLLKRL